MFELLKSVFIPPRHWCGADNYYKEEKGMVELGDLVEDEVTGFKGIAVAKYTYLQGCDRFGVQPVVSEGGVLPESQTFDEPQLLVLERGKVKRRAVAINPGGPEKCMPKAKQVDSRQRSLPSMR